MTDTYHKESLLQENQRLRDRLEELEETLRAIRCGEVDALVVPTPEGEQVYSLLGAEEPYRVMVENMSEGAVTLAYDGTLLYCNGRFAELIKTPHEQLIGQPFQNWVAAQDSGKFGALLAQGCNSIVRAELTLQAGDGTQLPVYFSMCPLPESVGKGIATVVTDLTEPKQAEHKIKERVKELRAFFHLSELAERKDFALDSLCQELMNVLPESWQYPEIACARLVVGDGEFRTSNFRVSEWMQAASVNVHGSVVGKIEVAYLEQKPEEDEGPFLKEERQLINAIAERVGHIIERKYTEQLIREEKSLSDTLIERLPDIFFVLDRQGGLVRWNRNGGALFGLPPEGLLGANALAFVHEEDKPLAARTFQETFDTGSAEAEVRLLLKDGERNYLLTTARVETGQKMHLICIGMDITERKRAEDWLRRANRALKILSAGNQVLVRAMSEEELLRLSTNVIVEMGGYRLAVVAYRMEDRDKSITPVAWSGMEDGHYWAEHVSWADTEQGQLPVSKAIRSGTTQICHDIASDTGFKPWKDAALARRYVSNIALPLIGGGRTFGALSIYSSTVDAFDAEEVELLEELANDLAYGIITLRTRIEHEQHATILRQSLEQSIQTIAGTLEARDPYNAGHQRRVAELATAIARKMGLPEEQVNGIHFAAIIHDLGKIHIPAEILAKPAKLSAIEFMFIKTHPQAGYDILKDVKFPWPITDIILQHHERLDGTGYPLGLKEGQILLEAKILTVSDVVEAMCSHRPYRPALGIKAAMDEIEQGKGRAYDPAVVDACLNLFNETGFTFSIDIEDDNHGIPNLINNEPSEGRLT